MTEPSTNRTVQWCAAAMAGVLVGLVPLFDDSPPARVLAVLLVLAAVPFGLLRQRQPWIWALVVAWPTVTLRFSQAGWHSIFLIVYSLVGVYLGDWISQWWAEAHPPARYNTPDAAGGQVAADGSRVAADGLPPEMPGRF